MSVLSASTQKQVEDALVEQGYAKPEQLTKLKAEASHAGMPLFAYILKDGLVTDEVLTKIIAKVNKLPYVNLTNALVDPQVLSIIPQDVAERYMAVALGEMQNRLVVAMLDADNIQAVDFLSTKVGRPLKVYAASEGGIRAVLKQYGADLKQVIDSERVDAVAEEEVASEEEKKEIKVIVQDSHISKALSAILEYATKNRASDIHIEPLEKELKIRCRIDGVLSEVMRLPKSAEPALVSRIKILSNMKIDEHRIPQDGQFTTIVDKRPVDLRIAISPVVWGEQVVIRLLDKTGTSLKLEDMGFRGRALDSIRQSLKLPNGMILTSGPTGSGKSTSLYALLQEVKSDAINIITLEDPVEYKVDGVNQIQVNNEVGLTFASGLRSVLRQDPDVVMVGEIRDKETATLAVQAALTGHLVFSTLHTNSAAGILPRLLDMGIEPFLIASTVRTVIGQRLVRRLGGKPEKYQSDASETQAIQSTLAGILPTEPSNVEQVSHELGYSNLPLIGQNAYTLSKGKDSKGMPGGFKGRMGLYEVFNVSEEIQNLILQRATSSEIQEMAQNQGMISMRQDGYLKALSGDTTLAEINRVAAVDSA